MAKFDISLSQQLGTKGNLSCGWRYIYSYNPESNAQILYRMIKYNWTSVDTCVFEDHSGQVHRTSYTFKNTYDHFWFLVIIEVNEIFKIWMPYKLFLEGSRVHLSALRHDICLAIITFVWFLLQKKIVSPKVLRKVEIFEIRNAAC